MKRTALKRTRPMPRKRPATTMTYDEVTATLRDLKKSAKRKSRYRSRPRDTAHMMRVKLLACSARDLSMFYPCGGVIEADHAGQRALSRKAPDDTCIPLCTLHHRQRTDLTGPFKSWKRDQMRSWLDEQIATTRHLLGVDNPKGT